MNTQKKYGLIGRLLDHSFSKNYFTKKFKDKRIGASYENIEVENLDKLKEIISEKDISGFNVTIPFKEKIIPLLDEICSQAKKVGAVNCVEITSESKWIGHNTDVKGFEKSLLNLLGIKRPEAIIFGSGGASKAVQYVLDKQKINFQIVSRNQNDNTLSYSDLTKEVLKTKRLLINTTPVGTFPNVEECLPLPYQYLSEKHFCFDLIYNPEKTEFLIKAEAQGACIKNGLEMLEIQAEESWKIWNNSK